MHIYHLFFLSTCNGSATSAVKLGPSILLFGNSFYLILLFTRNKIDVLFFLAKFIDSTHYIGVFLKKFKSFFNM